MGFVALTKPRIIELLLVTTVPAMFLAARGVPPLVLVALTMLGGCFAAASANVFNCVLDRDIDERMRRTRRRPLPRHAVGTRAATGFGLVLGVAATLWLGLAVNWLSSLLALGATAMAAAGLLTLAAGAGDGEAGRRLPRRSALLDSPHQALAQVLRQGCRHLQPRCSISSVESEPVSPCKQEVL